MIHFDEMDITEHHSEEMLRFFWCSVYINIHRMIINACQILVEYYLDIVNEILYFVYILSLHAFLLIYYHMGNTPVLIYLV